MLHKTFCEPVRIGDMTCLDKTVSRRTAGEELVSGEVSSMAVDGIVPTDRREGGRRQETSWWPALSRHTSRTNTHTRKWSHTHTRTHKEKLPRPRTPAASPLPPGTGLDSASGLELPPW